MQIFRSTSIRLAALCGVAATVGVDEPGNHQSRQHHYHASIVRNDYPATGGWKVNVIDRWYRIVAAIRSTHCKWNKGGYLQVLPNIPNQNKANLIHSLLGNKRIYLKPISLGAIHVIGDNSDEPGATDGGDFRLLFRLLASYAFLAPSFRP